MTVYVDSHPYYVWGVVPQERKAVPCSSSMEADSLLPCGSWTTRKACRLGCGKDICSHGGWHPELWSTCLWAKSSTVCTPSPSARVSRVRVHISHVLKDTHRHLRVSARAYATRTLGARHDGTLSIVLRRKLILIIISITTIIIIVSIIIIIIIVVIVFAIVIGIIIIIVILVII